MVRDCVDIASKMYVHAMIHDPIDVDEEDKDRYYNETDIVGRINIFMTILEHTTLFSCGTKHEEYIKDIISTLQVIRKTLLGLNIVLSTYYTD